MMKFLKNKKNKNRNSMNITTLTDNEKNELDKIKSRNSLDFVIDENSLYSKISSEDNSKLIDFYKNQKTPINYNESESEKIHVENGINEILCQYCNEYGNGNFTILNCNHIFHITCLANEHFENSQRVLIDEEFFRKRKCLVCHQQLELEDIQLIHNKYHKHTKEYITQQQNHIANLDSQMNKIKEELRVCFTFKDKLEKEKEKSKQIIITLNTFLL
jgi:hypothetical protein